MREVERHRERERKQIKMETCSVTGQRISQSDFARESGSPLARYF